MDTIWEFYETPLGPRPIHPIRGGRIPAQGHRRPRRIRVALDWAVGLVLPRVDIADVTELSRSRKEAEEHA